MSTESTKIPTDTNELVRQIRQLEYEGDNSGRVEQLRTALMKQGLDRPAEYTEAMRNHDELVKKYAGTPYADLFENNSYANLEYHRSWLDDLASVFGRDSKAYSTWLNERDSNLSAEDAKILASIQANEYNSPAEQAARMRAAGQNPDLFGTGDVSEASEVVPDETPISGSTAGIDEIAPIVSMVGSGLLSAISKGFEIYSSMETLNSSLDAQGIANYEGILNLAKQYVNLSSRMPEDKESLEDYLKSVTTPLSYDDLSSDDASEFLKNAFGFTFRSRHNKRLFSNSVSSYRQSSEYRDYLSKKYKQRISDILDVGKAQASPLWNPYSSEVTKAAKPLYKVMFDADMMKLNAALSQSRFDYHYWNNRQGSISAMYDQSIHRNQYLQQGYKTRVDYMDKEMRKLEFQFTSAYRQMINTLYRDANNGNTAAQAMLMGMFTGRSLLDSVSGVVSSGPNGISTKIGLH